MISRPFHRFGRGRTPRRSLKTLLGPKARRLAIEPLEARRMLATFTVNSIGDAHDTNPGDGIAADAAGSTTLRAAILEANAWAGPDTIAFNIEGSGPHTIRPLSALPAISESVVIDGYTQPGASANTSATYQAINAALKIELDGSLAGPTDGLRFHNSEYSRVRGLVINRFSGNGIYLLWSGNSVVEGN